MPHPKPITVEPAATVSVVFAVHATILGPSEFVTHLEDIRLTDPTIASTSPLTIVHLRPKMSEADPPRLNDTEDAMDQPPTIQVMFAVSPSRSVAIGTRILVTKTKPQEIGQTYERDNDCVVVNMLSGASCNQAEPTSTASIVAHVIRSACSGFSSRAARCGSSKSVGI